MDNEIKKEWTIDADSEIMQYMSNEMTNTLDLWIRTTLFHELKWYTIEKLSYGQLKQKCIDDGVIFIAKRAGLTTIFHMYQYQKHLSSFEFSLVMNSNPKGTPPPAPVQSPPLKKSSVELLDSVSEDPYSWM